MYAGFVSAFPSTYALEAFAHTHAAFWKMIIVNQNPVSVEYYTNAAVSKSDPLKALSYPNITSKRIYA